MKYRYAVNHNGVWYPAGSEVPKDTISVMDTEEPEVVEQEQEEPVEVEETPTEEETVESPYTKTEIRHMKKSDLLELAMSCGLSVSEALTTSELTRKLFKYYGL